MRHEGVAHVRRVVDGQAETQDEQHAGRRVDGDVPKLHRPCHVDLHAR